MILTMPWPAMHGLSPNHRVHWATKARAKKSLRAQWAWEATKQGARRMEAKKLQVSITFFPPDRRARDMDNMLSCCKAGLDGIADVLGVDDKHWSLRLSTSPETDGYVRLEIAEQE